MKFIEAIKPNNVNCPICKFETISFKKDNYDITICPYCFNNPAKEFLAYDLDDRNSNMRCDMCIHPECKLSLHHRVLAKCKYCLKGEIRLKDLKGNVEA